MGRKSKAAVSASPSASELSKGEAAAFGSIPRRAKARRFISRGRPGSEHQACNIVVLRRESDESVRGTHQIPEHIRGASILAAVQRNEHPALSVLLFAIVFGFHQPVGKH